MPMVFFFGIFLNVQKSPRLGLVCSLFNGFIKGLLENNNGSIMCLHKLRGQSSVLLIVRSLNKNTTIILKSKGISIRILLLELCGSRWAFMKLCVFDLSAEKFQNNILQTVF